MSYLFHSSSPVIFRSEGTGDTLNGWGDEIKIDE
jgi:hypothetical protein